jgi:glycosyltransferase involved in cell wall biosynthesis
LNPNASQEIRVLHTESSPAMGGQELRILYEMEAMAEHGFVSWLIARADTPIVAEAERRGLKVEGIPIRSTIDPLAILHFLRFLRRHRIDVVNAHNSKDGWNVSLAARLLGIPIVRSRHIGNPIRAGKFRQLIYGPLCDAVMTTSESIRQAMIDKGVDGNKIVSIPTGVDVQRYASGTPGRFRAALGIPADAPLVGQVAVLRGSKGPHVFLEAAQRLVAGGCPAWFVLVGEGPARQQLEKMLARQPSERIVLAGYRTDIPEGVPQAVLQAFAAGVPVIAADLGGINEVAIDRETAITLPARQVDAFAKAIAAHLADPQRGRENAERGRQLAETRYSREVMLQRMGELYRRLCPASRHGAPGER